MKCKKCNTNMKMTDKVDMEGKPVYKTFICKNVDCFNIVETIDGKIIGEEAEIVFIPGGGINE